MEVETYLIEENQVLISDPNELKKYQGMVENLGLEGQKELMEGNKSPIPFRPMSKEELAIYKICLPEKREVKRFRTEVIPIRVLSILALCDKEEYFKEIEVWSDTEDDPILVGKKGYSDPFYLLARWGKTLIPLSELRKKAIEIYGVELKGKIKTKIDKLQSCLEPDTLKKYFGL